MKSIKSITAFNQALLSRQDPQRVDSSNSFQVDQLKKLLELTKLYRQYEEAWFEKVRKKEFAVNEKDRMMATRRQLDQLLATIEV